MLGYCFFPFKDNCFFWDLFILVRKALIIFIASFFAADIYDFDYHK